ncbi:GNAT family N-acetyltransferase [Paenibacillus sonchi]|uniref:GNAT family N-acetyltransferase n=2 Tax=Paenibacillus sonchi TaxID=373687 RepID=A0A974SC97_9BACL|nr:GNAT family N-acetyltransferase [Paenibacillus sonchi]
MSGNMIVIETARLNIRKYTDEDTAALSAVLSDPLTMAFWPAPFTSRQTEEWIERNIQSYLTQGFGRWAVELKETGRLIGDAGIMKSELNGRVENDLGYIIHSDYWRQGYAYEAAKSILSYAVQELGESNVRRSCSLTDSSVGGAAFCCSRYSKKDNYAEYTKKGWPLATRKKTESWIILIQ